MNYTLYEDPVYYDYEYRDRHGDRDWYVARYMAASGPVLELGVGTGRMALPAVAGGARVVGLDLSDAMLDKARASCARLPASRRDNITLIQGDMRSFELGERFALVSCPFNSFQHLYTRGDVGRALACVADHLAPGGEFVFDVLMPNLKGELGRGADTRGFRFLHPTHQVEYDFAYESHYEPLAQLHHMIFRYTRAEGAPAEGPEQYAVELVQRVFFPEELLALLDHGGFCVKQRFGSFAETSLGPESRSMIMVCERA